MMRIGIAAMPAVFAGIVLATGASAQAPAAPSGTHLATTRLAQATQPVSTETPAQLKRRPPIRLRVYPRYEGEPDGVYPRYFPGRNAVRECTSSYVQEYRPSGTVIVPRMNCFWRRG